MRSASQGIAGGGHCAFFFFCVLYYVSVGRSMLSICISVGRFYYLCRVQYVLYDTKRQIYFPSSPIIDTCIPYSTYAAAPLRRTRRRFARACAHAFIDHGDIYQVIEIVRPRDTVPRR